MLSIGGELLETRNPTGKLMLTILGGVATWERDIMPERQWEGIAKAVPGRVFSISAFVNLTRISHALLPGKMPGV